MPTLPCGVQPRGMSSSTISAVHAAQVCVWKPTGCLWRSCVVWHFCGANCLARMKGERAHSLEAQVDVCRWGSPPEPGVSLASRHFLSRLHCYTPDRLALSRHFSKTAQSDGSGAQVGQPRTPSSDSNPVLTSQGTEGDIQIGRRVQCWNKQLCDLFVVTVANTPFSTFFSSFYFMVNSENWKVF